MPLLPPVPSLTTAPRANVRDQWMAEANPLASQYNIPIAYLASVSKRESGDRNIRQQVNSTGTATGPFQITEGTWNQQIRRHPELNLTAADRTNPAAQGRVIVTLTADNRDILKKRLGREPTPGELYLAHAYGAGGASNLLTSNRSTRVADILPAAVAANPQWRNYTVQDAIDRIGGSIDRATAGSTNMQSSAAPTQGGLLAPPPTPNPGGAAGMAGLFGGVPMAPMGTGLEQMTPEFRDILVTALRDPTLGPQALQTVLGLAAGSSGGGPALKPTDKITNAIAAGLKPGTPEWERAVVGDVSGVEAPKPTDIMREAASLYPNDKAAQDQYIRNYREKGGVNVNLNQPATPNPVLQDEFKGVMETGRAAQKALADIERGRIALQDLPTGAGQEFMAKAQMWAKRLGIDPSIIGPDITTKSQLLAAVSVPLALKVREAGTGQMSDKEQALYQSATIGLGNTPEANQFILDAGEAVFKRQIAERKFATEFVKKAGGITIDLPAALDDWRAQNPIFSDAFYKKWEPKLQTPATSGTNAPSAKAATPGSPNGITAASPGAPVAPGGDASKVAPATPAAPKKWKLQGGKLVPE